MKNITILGGGVLGSQIAFQTSYSGYNVTIYLRSKDSIKRCKKKLEEVKKSYIDAINVMKNNKNINSWSLGIADFDKFNASKCLKKVEEVIDNIKLELDIDKSLKDADLVLKSSINAATLFFTKLFPCMFIFYTLQDLLLNYGILKLFIKFFSPLSKKLFHLDACSSYIIFMSMLTGFPSGSKYITDFYNKKYIDRNTANYLLTFTHFSNPLFILGTVSIITTKSMALIILLSHFLSNFVVAFFTRPKLYIEKSIPQTREKKSLTTCLNDSFQNTFLLLK